tara:strand:- start:20342 stop:20689 length:348 start_codon:yes stop_codon:yes gene_type:complete
MFGRVSSADDMFCANGVVGAVEQGVFDEHFAIFASVVDVFPCFSAREGELVGSPTDNVASIKSAPLLSRQWSELLTVSIVQAFDDFGAVAADYSAGVEYLQSLGAKLQIERGKLR